tara:strand:- start:113 stop:1051 length:939 start_codon:yes stop_codon:yes gene_type:complete
MADNKMPKNAEKYICELCRFSCSKESNYNKHMLTRKHQNASKGLTNADEKMPKNADFTCDCGNTYKHRQSLYKHQKYCLMNENNEEQMNYSVNNICKNTQQSEFKELILLLLKENKEIQKNFIDIIPHLKGNNNNSHNTITNNTTNNNQFNINMFLNEHCKNAMNITDFIESLPLTAEAYNNTIENGLTKNITTMITDGLNNMDILKRPIHCTDPARKTIYIKDNDVWEKDTELKLLLENITHLACKHRGNIHKWQDVNEGWEEIEDLQTKLTNIVYHTMEDVENDEKEMNKIYRAISKNTYLNNDIKDQYK